MTRTFTKTMRMKGDIKMLPTKENLEGKIDGYTKDTIREIKDKVKEIVIVLGLVGGILLGLNNNVFATNPSDLTGIYRQIPVQLYAICYEVDKSKWLFASVPFGKQKDNSVSVFGWASANNDEKFLQGHITTKKGIFSLGLQPKIFIDGGDTPAEFTASIDADGKYVGLATIVNLKDFEKTQLGARINLRDVTAYLKIPLKESNPMYGLKWSGKVELNLAYEPKSETSTVRLLKAIETRFGTVISELRTKYNDDGQFYGIVIMFIPAIKK